MPPKYIFQKAPIVYKREKESIKVRVLEHGVVTFDFEALLENMLSESEGSGDHSNI